MVDEAQASAYRGLIDIGLALSAEKNLDSLLEHILLEAKSMANADRGTIYLRAGKDALKFSIVLNDSLGITQGGKTGDPITLPDVLLVTAEGKPNFANIASCAVQRGETIVVDDARAETEFDFSGTRSFDEMLGYRSTSFLSVPLKTMSDESIGVLQLLNALDENGEVIPFPREIVPLIEALTKLSEAHIILK